MIRFAGQGKFGRFLEFLNNHYPASEPVEIVFLPGYDCIGDEEGNPEGWATYDPEERVIWCPRETPDIPGLPPVEAERIVLESIAHEYVHHLQECEGWGRDEDEAERWASDIVDRFLAEGGGDGTCCQVETPAP